MEKIVEKLASFGGAQVRSTDSEGGRSLSASGARGPFRMQAQVAPAAGGKPGGTFSLSTR
jgi:hypothetical protein